MKKLIIVSGVAALLAGSLFAADGATLYKKCAACHGPKAEKVYLNKVPVLNTLSKESITESLKGYKVGTLDKFKTSAITQRENVRPHLRRGEQQRPGRLRLH